MENHDRKRQDEADRPVGGEFRTTHWSLVLAAGQSSPLLAAEALATLCREYWYPLYAFVRRLGHSPDDAQDLTQAFFERILEKNYIAHADPNLGRFRSFLIVALKRFLTEEWNRQRRQKRGAGQTVISFDAAGAEERYRLEPRDLADPERIYERRWAMTLLERVFQQLEKELAEGGRPQIFPLLKGFLAGDHATVTYAEAAEQLAMSQTAVRMTVSRMRRRCRELLRSEIAQTVASPAEIEEEYKALFAALSQ